MTLVSFKSDTNFMAENCLKELKEGGQASLSLEHVRQTCSPGVSHSSRTMKPSLNSLQRLRKDNFSDSPPLLPCYTASSFILLGIEANVYSLPPSRAYIRGAMTDLSSDSAALPCNCPELLRPYFPSSE